MIRVLCIDDRWEEEGLDGLFKTELKKLGIRISFESECSKAISSIHNNPKMDLVLLDLKLPDDPEQGKALLKDIKQLCPSLPVIILSGLSDSAIAEECCVELGAAFYFIKDEFSPMQLGIGIRNAVKLAEKVRETECLQATVEELSRFDRIVGTSEAIKGVLGQVREICHSQDTTVILTGEKGVGKDLVAEMIHTSTEERKNGRFVRILCSAIPENILESELFGVIPNYPGFHSPGGLTGKFKEADCGTVFLNEIGDMPLSIQAKVLEVIERKAFHPLGGTDEVKVDVRIIAASNQPLKEKVKSGHFRGDLFDRLRVYSIHVPALRERKEDIPGLVAHFLEKFNFEQNRSVQKVSDDVLEMLSEYDWPGNVRELRNVVERAFVVSAAEGARILKREHFARVQEDRGETLTDTESRLVQEFLEAAYAGKTTLNDIPRKYQLRVVTETLRREKGVGTRVAKILGITSGALRRKLSDWRISTLACRQ